MKMSGGQEPEGGRHSKLLKSPGFDFVNENTLELVVMAVYQSCVLKAEPFSFKMAGGMSVHEKRKQTKVLYN